MHIDKNLISKLENLSMLKLSDSEKEEVGKDLNEILSMIKKLEEYDTEGVEPLAYLTNVINVSRDDIVGNHLDRKAGLKNAKSKNEQYFIVPKVIK